MSNATATATRLDRLERKTAATPVHNSPSSRAPLDSTPPPACRHAYTTPAHATSNPTAICGDTPRSGNPSICPMQEVSGSGRGGNRGKTRIRARVSPRHPSRPFPRAPTPA
jgi:hypothetical protein